MRLQDLTTPFRSLDPVEAPVLTRVLREIISAVRGNPYTHYEDVQITTPAAADTTFAVTLTTLNATPTGYVVVEKDRACDVYTAPVTSVARWGKNLLFLRCSVAAARITLRVT